MAVYRVVHTDFWNDVKIVENFTPEDKLFFLYLLTNSNTTQIGVYTITKKQMAYELGYSNESINALMQRFIDHHKMIKYDEETRELVILNWGKWNLNRVGGKPVYDLLQKEVKTIKNKKLLLPIYSKVEQEKIKAIIAEPLEALGLIEPDTSRGTLRGTLRGQKEKEKEKEKENNNILSSKSSTASLFFQIIEYLNKKADTRYKADTKATQRLIKARIEEGFTIDDFKTVIDNKCGEWLHDEKMNQYLRPQTLFGTKFESYLNTPTKKVSGEEKKWSEPSW